MPRVRLSLAFCRGDRRLGGVMADLGYDGFISYSHQHDAALGPALQTRLERFAKPWYKMRALRIFLDTADLSANPALWPSIEEGLGSSRWFILLASADAAQSKWVNREAQWWINHGPRDRLLVVGTSPGMDWDEKKRDWAADAPVPSALRGALRVFASVAISPDDRLLAATGVGLVSRSVAAETWLWEINPHQAAAYVCAVGGSASPSITQAQWRLYFSGEAYSPPCPP
jgi:TIR domain